ncbi:MAG TPA: AAA family ATPase [Spirochaetota bacterium]|nr:AAA family ATPase [Spirochaetota bacterium]
MFLKSMDLYGFKSFADKTQVTFEPGITVIIGPNGCGKSNVVDAIKWVLGEKQAKNIRGEKMEDIIFAGTEHRKQLSLSEVFVTIDNSNRVLDFDSDSVTVGRRIFRDGESEYLINKSPVRLKDVEKLFMDTGIGKASYSVMEQGKMDLILSTRPEDRRYIFEEAAGISKYKFQKKESLRKLTETSDNLERINDIIKEIEREKDFKSKQAETTKVYLSLKTELSELDIKTNVLRFRELSKKQAKIQEDIERHNMEREAISSRVSTTSADNEKDEKRKNDIQHQLFELEKRLHAYRIRVEDIDVKTEKNRGLIEEEQNLKKGIENKIVERTKNLDRLLEEKQKSEQSGVEIGRKIEDDREKLSAFFTTRKRKIDSIHASRDSIEEKKAAIKDAEKGHKELQALLEEVIRKLVDAIEKRKAELEGSEHERTQVRGVIHERLRAIEESLRRAAADLRGGMPDSALALLETIDMDSLKDDILKFESYEDGFRSILFDKTGIHAEKESLDRKIREKLDSIERLRGEITALEAHIQHEQVELEDVNQMITRVEKDLSRNENERDWIEKHIQSLGSQIIDFKKQIENYREEILRADKKIKELSEEIKEWDQRLVEFNERSESLLKEIADLTAKREEIENKIHDRKNVARKDEEELQRIVDRITALDKSQVELIFKKNSIEEHLWIEYEKKIKDVEALNVLESQMEGLMSRSQDIKKQIQDLGPINNLAIEEYRNLKKRFEYYIKQKKDIEKAREDIFTVIEDINRTSIEMFMETFKSIQKNFSDIFRQLFEGGEAAIELNEPDNPLESGIEVMIRPPGKKLKNINLLSGGERALTAIALLFATYMVKPSPFCFLDEIDAPLDEQNIGRFVRMLKEFARGSQFIIVTHNKKTMSIGETLYGVTMEEPGVSKLVSIKMDKIEGSN